MQLIVALLLAALLAGTSTAQELNTFKNGEVADADKINQNFESLQSKIQTLEEQLTLGFDGSVQQFNVDCTENANALEEVFNASLSNDAQINIVINGVCSANVIYAGQGKTIEIQGSDPTEDKLMGVNSWAVVYARGEIILSNVGVVMHPNNRTGVYAWRGGSLYLVNVNIYAPPEGLNNAYACASAELGSNLYVNSLKLRCGYGIQLNASAAWLRGDIDVISNSWGIFGRGGAAYIADRVRLTVSGSPAINMRDSASYRQLFGDGNTSYQIEGDISVSSGSALNFHDDGPFDHLSGSLTATDSFIHMKKFTTSQYSLVRSSGYLEPANDAALITAKGSNFALVAPESQSPNLQVNLVNSTVQYLRGNGPSPASFNCSGFSNVEMDGVVLELPGTGKCAIQEQ